MNFLDIVKSELKFQKHLLRQFNALRRIKDDGQLFCKKNKEWLYKLLHKRKKRRRKTICKKKIGKRNAAGLHASGKRFRYICG